MKMLRQAVAKAQDTNMVLALEARVNELRELTALIPEYQELSQNLSLESVVNHIRGREAGIPQVIEKFSLRTMALENDGLIFAGVIAVIAAITALILRFTDWLGGGSSSSSGGGGGGSSSSAYTVRMSTGETPEQYLARIRARAEREAAYRKAMNDYNEVLRRARDAAFDAKMDSLREKMHKGGSQHANKASSGSTYQTPPKQGKSVSSIQDILDIWIKEPENKDTTLAKFLNNTDPMYREISERGEYYQTMVGQEKLSMTIAKRIKEWPGRLHLATTIIKQMAQGGATEEVMQGLEDKMIALRSPEIMVDLPRHGAVTLEQYCLILNTRYEQAWSRTGSGRIHFEKLHEHFFTTEVIHLAANMLKDLDDAAANMKKTQEHLDELQDALKAMPAHSGPGALAHKTIVQDTNVILDSARRDVMSYVRCTHHTKRFSEIVRRMDAEMTRANTAVINILKKVDIPDSEDKAALNEARKKFEESMTLDV